MSKKSDLQLMVVVLLFSIFAISVDKPDNWLGQAGNVIGVMLLILSVIGLVWFKFFEHEKPTLLEPDRVQQPADWREKTIYEWEATSRGAARAEDNGQFRPADGKAPYGYFQGRPIIGRDAAINGGVYIGGSAREALVVDDQKYPEQLDQAFRPVLLAILPDFLENRLQAMTALGYVRDVVATLIPFSDAVADKAADSKRDRKVALNDFIGRGGVCRHQALLAAYLVERLIRASFLRGSVSIDRSQRHDGAHAWVRFTIVGGEVYILDVTHGVLDCLANTHGLGWRYHRDSDLAERSRI